MALADTLKPVLWQIRAIPGNLGLRPHTVHIVRRFAYGQATGEVDMADVIPVVEGNGQSPKVRWLNDAQLALAGLGRGTVDIGPITPGFETGGTDLANLDARNLETGDTLHVLITGPSHPDGALYKVQSVTTDRAMHYILRATPVSQSPE